MPNNPNYRPTPEVSKKTLWARRARAATLLAGAAVGFSCNAPVIKDVPMKVSAGLEALSGEGDYCVTDRIVPAEVGGSTHYELLKNIRVEDGKYVGQEDIGVDAYRPGPEHLARGTIADVTGMPEVDRRRDIEAGDIMHITSGVDC